MTETDGDVELPYTVTGSVVPLYTFSSNKIAAQCCYLRSGGANECSYLGGGSGGWSEFMTPANAVSWANAYGIAGCEGFGTDVNDATWASSGIFKGGMGMNVSIATVECDTACTA